MAIAWSDHCLNCKVELRRNRAERKQKWFCSRKCSGEYSNHTTCIECNKPAYKWFHVTDKKWVGNRCAWHRKLYLAERARIRRSRRRNIEQVFASRSARSKRVWERRKLSR